MTSRAKAADQVPTTGSVRLVPDPRSLEALGRNHTLEAAIAELVDNSIDAGAKHVLVRFVRDGDRLVRLLVVDDGCGMGEEEVDVAMTVGGSREYRPDEIGRFGLGMKAASFSQARTVTVVSAARRGEVAGRQWRLEKAKRDYACEIVRSRVRCRSARARLGTPAISHRNPRPLGRRQSVPRGWRRNRHRAVLAERFRQDSGPPRAGLPPNARSSDDPPAARR